MFLLSQNLYPVVRKNTRTSITLWKASSLMKQEGEFVVETVTNSTSPYGITALVWCQTINTAFI